MANWREISESRLAQFSCFLLFALAIRAAALADWFYDVDDQLYILIGQRMLRGALLYVDLWDRKGPALYLTYAAVAALSSSLMAFRLAAVLAAALGGYGINRIARLIAAPQGAMLAGLAYCTLLGEYGGGGGQAPVFYNLPMIAAAWCLATRLDLLSRGHVDARVVAGMLSAGIAIMFKQSALIESVFFGVTVMIFLARSGIAASRVWQTAAMLALVGATPTLAAVLFYAGIGHFPELWQATVLSNFSRNYNLDNSRLARLGLFTLHLALPLGIAVLGFLSSRKSTVTMQPLYFVAAWAIVAIAAVLVVPNIFDYYALPLLAPLCLLGAGLYSRRDIGLLAGLGLISVILVSGHVLDFGLRAQSRNQGDAIADYVRRETPHRHLLVFGEAAFLYVLTDAPLPSRLTFPPHLYDTAELHASPLDPVREVHRILAQRPETVVLDEPLSLQQANPDTVSPVVHYAHACPRVRRFVVNDYYGTAHQAVAVYSGCAVRAM